MPTECSAKSMGFAPVDGRAVVADFDGGEITSNAGGLLLGATDRAIGLVERFATCFTDGRSAERVVHEVATLVGQRVFGIALGYEDVVDHDQLRFDPVLATLAGKLTARRKNCAPLAGKSTLNRLEHAPSEPARYHKIGHDGAAIERLFVDLFLEAHKTPPGEIILDLDATDDPLHGHQEGRFFHGYYDCYCYLPLYVFCGSQLLAARLRRSNIDAAAGAVEDSRGRAVRNQDVDPFRNLRPDGGDVGAAGEVERPPAEPRLPRAPVHRQPADGDRTVFEVDGVGDARAGGLRLLLKGEVVVPTDHDLVMVEMV